MARTKPGVSLPKSLSTTRSHSASSTRQRGHLAWRSIRPPALRVPPGRAGRVGGRAIIRISPRARRPRFRREVPRPRRAVRRAVPIRQGCRGGTRSTPSSSSFVPDRRVVVLDRGWRAACRPAVARRGRPVRVQAISQPRAASSRLPSSSIEFSRARAFSRRSSSATSGPSPSRERTDARPPFLPSSDGFTTPPWIAHRPSAVIARAPHGSPRLFVAPHLRFASPAIGASRVDARMNRRAGRERHDDTPRMGRRSTLVPNAERQRRRKPATGAGSGGTDSLPPEQAVSRRSASSRSNRSLAFGPDPSLIAPRSLACS